YASNAASCRGPKAPGRSLLTENGTRMRQFSDGSQRDNPISTNPRHPPALTHQREHQVHAPSSEAGQIAPSHARRPSLATDERVPWRKLTSRRKGMCFSTEFPAESVSWP